MGNCLDCIRRSLSSGDNSERVKELDSVLVQDDSLQVLSSPSGEKGTLKQTRSEDTVNNLEKCEEGGLTGIRSDTIKLEEYGEGELTGVRSVSYSPSNPKVIRRLFESQSPSLTPEGSEEDSLAGVASYEPAGRKRGGAVVDVNYCNEHELCVVGFTREEARAVISHRIAHGKFRRTSEVETVKGISGETWQRAKSKISLVPASSLIHLSSPRQKRNVKCEKYRVRKFDTKEVITIVDRHDEDEDVKIIGEGKSLKRDIKQPTVDLNHANVHELRCVGFDQVTSHEVVNYRIQRQGFRSIDEIKCIPGVTDDTFDRVSTRLALSPIKSVSTRRRRRSVGSNAISSLTDPSRSPLNKLHIAFSASAEDAALVPAPDMSSFRKDSSASRTSLSNGVAYGSEPCGTTPVILEAESVVPRSPLSLGKSANKSIRIATWNLQCFSNEKVGNLAVLEVVCATIIRHG